MNTCGHWAALQVKLRRVSCFPPRLAMSQGYLNPPLLLSHAELRLPLGAGWERLHPMSPELYHLVSSTGDEHLLNPLEICPKTKINVFPVALRVFQLWYSMTAWNNILAQLNAQLSEAMGILSTSDISLGSSQAHHQEVTSSPTDQTGSTTCMRGGLWLILSSFHTDGKTYSI